MLKKHRVGLLALLFLSVGFLTVAARLSYAAPEFQQLTDYLEQSYPHDYRVVASVSAKNNGRIALIPENGFFPHPGQELLVLKQQAETPLYLLPVVGVVQLGGQAGEVFVSRQVAEWGDIGPAPGDPVVIPVSPTIYLYTGDKGGREFALSPELVQTLLKNGFSVKETGSMDIDTRENSYGILLRMEKLDNNLSVTLQSIFSGAILFSETYPPSPNPVKTGSPLADAEKTMGPSGAGSDFQQVNPRSAAQFIRLTDNFDRMVVCQADETEALEFAFLNRNKIEIFQLQEEALLPVCFYEFEPKNRISLHLHAMDLTGDGRDELMVTTGCPVISGDARTTEIDSCILGVENRRLFPLAENLPFYLRVIADHAGKPLLLGQKKGDYQAYNGNIVEMHLDASGGINAEAYGPAGGIHSVYQFSLIPAFPEHLMILEPSGAMSVYSGPTGKIVSATGADYGLFDIVSYPIASGDLEFIGGFNNKKTFTEYPTARRLVMVKDYGSQVFTINKQRPAGWNVNRLKNLLSEQKNQDSLVAFQWNGKTIRQSWESEKLSKDILDFSFMPGKDRDLIFLLVKDTQGYAVEQIQ